MDILKSIPLSSGCEIIATHECGLIAINKKAGRTSHPNHTGDKKQKPPMIRAKYNMIEEYYSWLDEEDNKHRLYLINRLDSPTSGVILAATSLEIAKLAKEQFKLKQVQKKYMAIVVGKVYPPAETWKDLIKIKKTSKYVRSKSSSESDAKLALTKYRVECNDENKLGLTLIQLEPTTGITHQLRVQCANHRYPILGDATYGNFTINKKIKHLSKISRLFLHCKETIVKINLLGQDIIFKAEAPLPESFNKIIRYNNEIIRTLI
ncbi:MAG: RNA pseudouridine synthase [Opitutales bacterium]|nr:RNA pseudouridine synthase [Opitutales bacterium]